MQARRHSAIWTVNRRAAGLDWKSSGRFGAGDQGLRCPPPWRVNRTGAPARLRTPMAPKGVRLRSSALRHQRSRQAGRTPAPLRSLQASALFIAGRSARYPCGLISRVEPGATPGPATNFRVTPSLGTERACKARAFVPAWFDSRVTHHHCGRSWKVEHLSATQENRFRLPTSAPTSPVSKSGDCTRLKNAGGQFESGAGHHFGAGSGLQLIVARSTSGVRLSVAPPSHSRRAISVRALRC